ncbi:abortive infection protein [Lelliottia amnigena]|uniref:abortive infection protein n=1 Tax=Lelliottia amnigena TaxID=61646 RepID=UPI004057C2DA
MDLLKDTEGTVLFPFQTEIDFFWRIFTTGKDLSVSAWGHIGQKQYWSASLCILLLVAYVGLSAAVVWVVMPWLKAFFVSKFALSALWVSSAKGALIWGIGKMAATIRRKITPGN